MFSLYILFVAIFLQKKILFRSTFILWKFLNYFSHQIESQMRFIIDNHIIIRDMAHMTESEPCWRLVRVCTLESGFRIVNFFWSSLEKLCFTFLACSYVILDLTFDPCFKCVNVSTPHDAILIRKYVF